MCKEPKKDTQAHDALLQTDSVEPSSEKTDDTKKNPPAPACQESPGGG
jgi:hypothetical protein